MEAPKVKSNADICFFVFCVNYCFKLNCCSVTFKSQVARKNDIG